MKHIAGAGKFPHRLAPIAPLESFALLVLRYALYCRSR